MENMAVHKHKNVKIAKSINLRNIPPVKIKAYTVSMDYMDSLSSNTDRKLKLVKHFTMIFRRAGNSCLQNHKLS